MSGNPYKAVKQHPARLSPHSIAVSIGSSVAPPLQRHWQFPRRSNDLWPCTEIQLLATAEHPRPGFPNTWEEKVLGFYNASIVIMTKYSKTFLLNSLRYCIRIMYEVFRYWFWLRPFHSLSSLSPVAAHVDAVDLQLGRARTHPEVAPRRWPQMRRTSQCPQPFSPLQPTRARYGCFRKWWYPTTIGFPTKNDHFGVFWGYHHLRKHPYEQSLLLQSSQKLRLFQTVETKTLKNNYPKPNNGNAFQCNRMHCLT